jgi:hypothetical protein
VPASVPRASNARSRSGAGGAIDYKTDNDVTEDTPEQYAREHPGGQSEVCQQALATATGLKVREVALVHRKAGAEVRLSGGEVIG